MENLQRSQTLLQVRTKNKNYKQYTIETEVERDRYLNS